MFGNSEADDLVAFATLAVMLLVPIVIMIFLVVAVTARSAEAHGLDDTAER